MTTENNNEIQESVAVSEENSGYYPGDTGQLPIDARRVLVQLLIGPSLDAKRHSKLWPVLLRFETDIRSRLAELFLELVLDRDGELAFTRQADTEELDSPILLRRINLTFIDSVLMLYLRQQLAEADIRGERAVVSIGELNEQLALFENSVNTDHAGFIKRVKAAIEKAKTNNILNRISGSDDRYEISATLKLLFSAEEVANLSRRYRSLLGEQTEEGAE